MNAVEIQLSQNELHKCIRFAGLAATQQQRIEFGQHDTAERDIPAMIVDIAIGKIAEAAFSKYCQQKHDISVELDYDVYERGLWDQQDAVINDWMFDIKASKSGSRWLLIDWNKLDFRHQEGKLAHIYVMATVEWLRTGWLGRPTGKVFFQGGISFKKLNHTDGSVLRKGDYLPGTRTRLQADNYGYRFNELADIDYLLDYVLHNSPPSTTDYISPFKQDKQQQYWNFPF